MSRRTWIAAAALLSILAGPVSCSSGGGGGSSSPFPRAVSLILGDLEDSLRRGDQNLPAGISCGGTISSPFAAFTVSDTVPIASSGAAHAGSVASVNRQITESRNPNGSGTITVRILDTADPARAFVNSTGGFKAPRIRFVPPPMGAKDLLATDGTGQSFVVLKIERTINWTRTFANDPTGSVGTGTLVDFAGPPVIPTELDGTITGESTEALTFLVEFDILAGPPTNSACIVDVYDVSDRETALRDGSGFQVAPLEIRHETAADTIAGIVNAEANAHATILPVGVDALASNPVADGDDVHLTNGDMLGGITGFPVIRNENQVDDAGGAVVIVSDGVGNPTDGDFTGVSIFNIDVQLAIAGGPGGVDNGTVEVSVLTLDASQLEDPLFDDLDHPVVDESILWGAVTAETSSGTIIFR